MKECIEDFNIDVVINCAAYTNVNDAEINRKQAILINAESVNNISSICEKKNIQLIHISSDYVFDGKKNGLYFEHNMPNPINYYGFSKLSGENSMKKYKLKNSIILRTSWLYSDVEDCFLGKILNKIYKNESFFVVNDQFGSPTNAFDLANVILKIIPRLNNRKVETYHYSNVGFCSRYDFALKVKEIIGAETEIKPIQTNSNNARRPNFSALSIMIKILNEFNIKEINWSISLENLIKEKILK